LRDRPGAAIIATRRRTTGRIKRGPKPMIRLTRAAAALLPIALLVAACGASTTSGAPSGSAGASSPAAQPSTPAAASPSTAGEESTPPIGAIPSFDVSQVLAGLSKVDSYKETITVDGKEVYSATVVTKPTLARSISTGGSTIVIIGDKAWMSQDGTTFQSVPASMVTPMIGAFDPSLMIGAFGSAAWPPPATDMGAEQKNGVSAHHYRIDSTSPNAALLALPAGATIDVWIADDDYLVAVETTGFAGSKNVQIEITNVDDPANKVDEPS
jgi:hypothetical protein